MLTQEVLMCFNTQSTSLSLPLCPVAMISQMPKLAYAVLVPQDWPPVFSEHCVPILQSNKQNMAIIALSQQETWQRFSAVEPHTVCYSHRLAFKSKVLYFALLSKVEISVLLLFFLFLNDFNMVVLIW